MLFISHDLAVVERIADRVAVMYRGKIVELAETDRVIGSPLHPYTQALLSAVPSPDPDIKQKRVRLEGEIPSVIDLQGLPSALLARLDVAIRENIGAGVFPAASLAVYRRGEAVFRGAWGWLDPETRQRPTGTETRFDLASLTKLFTTTATLLQMEAQRLQLNTPLADVLPEFASERLRPIVGQQDPHTLAPIPAASVAVNTPP